MSGQQVRSRVLLLSVSDGRRVVMRALRMNLAIVCTRQQSQNKCHRTSSWMFDVPS